MAYQVSLKQFDGPLDLLLTLIGKASIDIQDIFVSEITEQYLAYMEGVDELDMDSASEFLQMAATLVEIKSRAMLPKPPKVEDENGLTPEEALVLQLQEYKRFKEASAQMQKLETEAKDIITKLPEEYPLPPQETELVGLTLEGLTEAFLRIWARKPDKNDTPEVNHYAPRDIHRDEHSVQECMLTLLHGIKKHGRMRFEEAFSDAPSREEVVTLFLALLELLKLGQMHAEQDGTYGEIVLLAGRREDNEEENAHD